MGWVLIFALHCHWISLLCVRVCSFSLTELLQSAVTLVFDIWHCDEVFWWIQWTVVTIINLVLLQIIIALTWSRLEIAMISIGMQLHVNCETTEVSLVLSLVLPLTRILVAGASASGGMPRQLSPWPLPSFPGDPQPLPRQVRDVIPPPSPGPATRPPSGTCLEHL